MTLPTERLNSVNRAREFLLALLDPKKTPRVPKNIRKQAGQVLKHFPGEFHMEEAKKAAPKLFGNWDGDR